ncbi:MAG: T9SS type A sorting domain-containing protein [Cytophagaceae bacterium]
MPKRYLLVLLVSFSTILISNAQQAIWTFYQPGIIRYYYLPEDCSQISGSENFTKTCNENYSIIEEHLGLPSNNITHIAVGSDEYVYVNTSEGIAVNLPHWKRLNNFNSSLVENKFRMIRQSSSGAIVGLGFESFFTLNNGILKSFLQNEYPEIPFNFLSPASTLDESNRVWFYNYLQKEIVSFSNGTSIRYDRNQVPLLANASVMNAIEEDQEGNIWFGLNNGLLKFNGTSWSSFTTENSELSDHNIIDLHYDPTLGLLALTQNALFSYSGSDFDEHSTLSPFLEDKVPGKVVADNSGKLWITSNLGLIAFSSEGEYTLYNSGNSDLLTDNILSVAVDHTNTVWIGTAQGLTQLSEDEWETISVYPNQLLETPLHSAKYTNNSLLTISNNHLYQLQNGHWTKHSTDKADPFLNSMTIDSDNVVWLGSDSGLISYDMHTWHFFNTDNSEIESNRASKVFSDRENSIWFSVNNNSFSRFTGSNFENYDGTTEPSFAEVSSFTEDNDGNLWISAFYDAKIAQKTISWDEFDFSHLGYPETRDFVFGKNNTAWMATDKGLIIMENGIFTNYSTLNSDLPENNLYSLHYQNDSLWIGTDTQGPVLYTNDRFYTFDFNELNFKRITSISGSPNEKIVFTTTEGIWLHHPSLLPVHTSNYEKIEDFVKVFPNPVLNELSIITSDEYIANLYDISGNLIFSLKNEKTINMERQKPGIYILRLLMNEEFKVFKLIKI